MRIGSLFSGYGGLDLALGGTVAWHAEIDKHPAAILAHHHPDVPNLGDITAVDWRDVEPVDVLTAGYPCQPFSHAGKRKGHHDPRHLWPYAETAIGHLRPRLVVLENVAGHLTLGGPAVVGSLTRMGYDARWGVVRAADAGAPHRRARLFIVAEPADGYGVDDDRGRNVGPGRWAEPTDSRDAAPDTGSERHGRGQDTGSVGRVDRDHAGEARQRQRPREESGHRSGTDWGPYAPAIARWETVLGRPAPNPTVDGRLSPRFVEWMMGLPDGWVTGVPIPRNAQLKALGNGVVPQQARLALDLLGVTA